MDIIDELKKVIEDGGIIEMEYENYVGTVNSLTIADLNFSQRYGEDYIEAYVYKSGQYYRTSDNGKNDERMTFKIERIRSLRYVWIPIVNKSMTASRNGVYVFMYESDNHIGFEAYKLRKGEALLKSFIGEYEHAGFMDCRPFAYCYINEYMPGQIQGGWIDIPKEDYEKWKEGYTPRKKGCGVLVALENVEQQTLFYEVEDALLGLRLHEWGSKVRVMSYYTFLYPIDGGFSGNGFPKASLMHEMSFD